MVINYAKAEFLTSYGTIEQMQQSTKHEIAFAGRSNVGKSSIINKLLNRKNIARVSSMPGKTATINFYDVDTVHFVDLPGYGYAKVAKAEKHRWSDLIEGYFNSDRQFTLVVLLIDIRHKVSELDRQMTEYLIKREMPFIIVFTKADKITNSKLVAQVEQLKKDIPYADEIEMICCSSLTGMGIDKVKAIIEEVSAVEFNPTETEQESMQDEQ